MECNLEGRAEGSPGKLKLAEVALGMEEVGTEQSDGDGSAKDQRGCWSATAAGDVDPDEQVVGRGLVLDP